MKQQDWTEQWRQRLANYEEPVPEGLWEQVEQRLPARRPARRVVLWRRVAAVAACVLLLVGVWRLSGSLAEGSAPPAESALQEKTETPPLAPPHAERGATAVVAEVFAPSAKAAKVPALSAAPALQGKTEPSPQTSPHEGTGAVMVAGDSAVRPHHANAQEPGVDAPLPSRKGTGSSNFPSALPELRAPSSPRRPSLQLHTTGLLAQGGTTMNEPMLMTPSYMGASSHALARSAPVYLARHEEKTEHRMPLSVGLSLRLPVGRHWWLASGIDYSLLTSTFTRRLGTSTQSNRQRLHYLGLPLTAGYTFWQSPRLTAYASAGGEAQLNVKAQVDNGSLQRDRVQFSLLGAAGVEYRLLPRISVYAQPGLRYYPDNGSRLQNAFKERPLQFDLQLGLRFSLQ